MPTPRIIVFGGSGFLGSHICRAAINRNCQVTSISRSGGPQTHDDRGVTYHKADIFHPENYRTTLKNATAVIYSAGMLLESDYKGLAQGNWDGKKVLGLLRQFKSRNPLDADPKRPSGYNALNRDGAILVAREAFSAGVRTFTFISAAGNFPGVPARYTASKREAEATISQIEGLRSIFIRPGLMYSKQDRPYLSPLKGIISGIAGINQRLGGNLPLVGAAGVTPLDVQLVAEAVIEATLDSQIKGIVDVDTLSRLACKTN